MLLVSFRQSGALAGLKRRRLSLAQTLLTKTDLRLADIALKAGFADQSHFSRSFQQCMGLSPGAFRRHHG
jgi:AraC family transcriptional regulator